MTLPKAISDAIDAYQKAVNECKTIRYTKFGKECISEARAALERAIADHAAATPAPSALERLRERVDAAASYEAIDLGEWRAFDKVLDWIDEEREREAKR
jgi:DNA-binding FadR family transcriptional regulator